MLLAAQRRDVDAVITVAANLDHRAWTAHHGDTPLHCSLNAADFARRLQSVPQVHYAGEKDKRRGCRFPCSFRIWSEWMIGLGP